MPGRACPRYHLGFAGDRWPAHSTRGNGRSRSSLGLSRHDDASRATFGASLSTGASTRRPRFPAARRHLLLPVIGRFSASVATSAVFCQARAASVLINDDSLRDSPKVTVWGRGVRYRTPQPQTVRWAPSRARHAGSRVLVLTGVTAGRRSSRQPPPCAGRRRRGRRPRRRRQDRSRSSPPRRSHQPQTQGHRQLLAEAERAIGLTAAPEHRGSVTLTVTG